MYALDEVRDTQLAFLRLLDSSMAPADMAVAARRLLGAARAHSIPELAVPALEWVLTRHLDELAAPTAEYGSTSEVRVLELHRKGEHTCRRCLLPLPAAETIRRGQRERVLAAMWRDWLRARRRTERKAAA